MDVSDSAGLGEIVSASRWFTATLCNIHFMLLKDMKKSKPTSFWYLTNQSAVGFYLNRQLYLSVPRNAFSGNQVRSAEILQTSEELVYTKALENLATSYVNC